MLTTLTPPMISLLLMITIPAVVTVLVRRHDRARPPRSERGVPAGALFVVHGRRWTHVMVRVIGIAIIVVGALLFATGAFTLGDPDSVPPFIAGVVGVLFGIGFVLLASGMKRRCIEVYDGHLLVVPMFGAVLRVRPEDIVRIRPSTNRLGGVDIKVAGRFSVVAVTGIDIGHDELGGWLEHFAPEQWGEFVRLYVA